MENPAFNAGKTLQTGIFSDRCDVLSIEVAMNWIQTNQFLISHQMKL